MVKIELPSGSSPQDVCYDPIKRIWVVAHTRGVTDSTGRSIAETSQLRVLPTHGVCLYSWARETINFSDTPAGFTFAVRYRKWLDLTTVSELSGQLFDSSMSVRKAAIERRWAANSTHTILTASLAVRMLPALIGPAKSETLLTNGVPKNSILVIKRITQEVRVIKIPRTATLVECCEMAFAVMTIKDVTVYDLDV